jgi:hypothetical protein
MTSNDFGDFEMTSKNEQIKLIKVSFKGGSLSILFVKMTDFF